MNRNSFLTILLFLGMSVTIQAQVPSSCSPDPVLLEHYTKDVKHLTLTRIFEVQSPYMDSIEIPVIFEDTIWQPLAAIFNASEIPERDSVFDIYCIHQIVSNVYFETMAVLIDTACPWYDNWANYVITTGVPEIDRVFDKYMYEVSCFHNNTRWAFLELYQSLNIIALGNWLSSFDWIEDTEPSGYLGDGSNILYTPMTDGWDVAFELGYGDCWNGCQATRTYDFHVYPDCSVAFQGATTQGHLGLPLPDPTNCMITGIHSDLNERPALKLYPNPASDEVMIETAEGSFSTYAILSVTGKILQEGTLLQNEPLHVGMLDPGIYFIILENKEQRRRIISKLLKQ